MKYTAHIPTEQYGFVEVEIEGKEGRNIADVYHEVSAMFRTGAGLSDKEFNAFIDNQLLGNGKNHIDEYNRMSDSQKMCVQTLKRGLKRISNKEE